MFRDNGGAVSGSDDLVGEIGSRCRRNEQIWIKNYSKLSLYQRYLPISSSPKKEIGMPEEAAFEERMDEISPPDKDASHPLQVSDRNLYFILCNCCEVLVDYLDVRALDVRALPHLGPLQSSAIVVLN